MKNIVTDFFVCIVHCNNAAWMFLVKLAPSFLGDFHQFLNALVKAGTHTETCTHRAAFNNPLTHPWPFDESCDISPDGWDFWVS